VNARKRIVTVVGTRPDVIKLAPVLHALERDPGFESVVVCTGQHREMIDDLLVLFGLQADVDLGVMRAGQGLAELTARLIAGLGEAIETAAPDLVLVQGDTTSALCGGLGAFYAGCPVAHLEAGLRTPLLGDPFPEEMNRRLVSRLADLHFAPTTRAAAALHAEGIDPASVEVTGNTVIDALLWVTRSGLGSSAFGRAPGGRRDGRRRILVTLHRREAQGPAMTAVAAAVAKLSRRGDVEVFLPLHMSPSVRASLLPELLHCQGITLAEPLGYADFAATLQDCDFVITDSGGVQEEAPALGKPVLVVRETTERPEAIEQGVAELVGLSPTRLLAAATRLLDEPDHYQAMARPVTPFGDGKAASRIVHRLGQRLQRAGAA